jgi:hypothetical protein
MGRADPDIIGVPADELRRLHALIDTLTAERDEWKLQAENWLEPERVMTAERDAARASGVGGGDVGEADRNRPTSAEGNAVPSPSAPAYSARHPHEPAIPLVLDDEGRCLVCHLMVERDAARADAADAAVIIDGWHQWHNVIHKPSAHPPLGSPEHRPEHGTCGGCEWLAAHAAEVTRRGQP